MVKFCEFLWKWRFGFKRGLVVAELLLASNIYHPRWTVLDLDSYHCQNPDSNQIQDLNLAPGIGGRSNEIVRKSFPNHCSSGKKDKFLILSWADLVRKSGSFLAHQYKNFNLSMTLKNNLFIWRMDIKSSLVCSSILFLVLLNFVLLPIIILSGFYIEL